MFTADHSAGRALGFRLALGFEFLREMKSIADIFSEVGLFVFDCFSGSGSAPAGFVTESYTIRCWPSDKTA